MIFNESCGLRVAFSGLQVYEKTYEHVALESLFLIANCIHDLIFYEDYIE